MHKDRRSFATAITAMELLFSQFFGGLQDAGGLAATRTFHSLDQLAAQVERVETFQLFTRPSPNRFQACGGVKIRRRLNQRGLFVPATGWIDRVIESIGIM